MKRKTFAEILDFLESTAPIDRQALADVVRTAAHDLAVRSIPDPPENDRQRLWGRIMAAAYEGDLNYDNATHTADAAVAALGSRFDR